MFVCLFVCLFIYLFSLFVCFFACLHIIIIIFFFVAAFVAVIVIVIVVILAALPDTQGIITAQAVISGILGLLLVAVIAASFWCVYSLLLHLILNDRQL